MLNETHHGTASVMSNLSDPPKVGQPGISIVLRDAANNFFTHIMREDDYLDLRVAMLKHKL